MTIKIAFSALAFLVLSAGIGFFIWRQAGLNKNSADQKSQAASWDVSRIETEDFTDGKADHRPDRVYFNNGTMIDTLGYGLKFLGKLKPEENPPVLLFSGRECLNCEEGMDFFVYSIKKSAALPYSYPAGKVSSQEDGGVYYQGRGFFGKCFLDGQEGVIAFGDFSKPDGSIKKVVTTYTFQPGDTFAANEVDASLFKIEDTLKKVSQGVCHEMPEEDYDEGAI